MRDFEATPRSRRLSSFGAQIWEWLSSRTRRSVDPERTLQRMKVGAFNSRPRELGGL